MLALFFEVNPRSDGGWDRYLAIAAGLRPLLAEQEGMLFIDRTKSASSRSRPYSSMMSRCSLLRYSEPGFIKALGTAGNLIWCT